MRRGACAKSARFKPVETEPQGESGDMWVTDLRSPATFTDTSTPGDRLVPLGWAFCDCRSTDPSAPAGDAVHLPAFFPKFRMPSTFSSILLRTTSKASF